VQFSVGDSAVGDIAADPPNTFYVSLFTLFNNAVNWALSCQDVGVLSSITRRRISGGRKGVEPHKPIFETSILTPKQLILEW